KCGQSLRRACVDFASAKLYFRGSALPAPSPSAQRTIVLRFYKRIGSKWKLRATKTVATNAVSGLWSATAPRSVGKGTWRIQASTIATKYLNAGLTGFRYFKKI